VTAPEYNTRAGNANIVMFRDDAWPYSEADHELAATWLTVDRSGTIVDADIEINATSPLYVPAADEELELGVIANQRDLMSILVHEAGHFLGIDHSREEGSVMQAALDVGEERSALMPDDEAAICAAYPPDAESGSCDYTPRGGFSGECGPVSEPSGCSVSAPGQHTAGPGLVGITATFAGLLTARRGRRR
jgi:hypothetical protein